MFYQKPPFSEVLPLHLRKRSFKTNLHLARSSTFEATIFEVLLYLIFFSDIIVKIQVDFDYHKDTIHGQVKVNEEYLIFIQW